MAASFFKISLFIMLGSTFYLGAIVLVGISAGSEFREFWWKSGVPVTAILLLSMIAAFIFAVMADQQP